METNVEPGMNRRSFLSAAALAPILAAIAACGDPTPAVHDSGPDSGPGSAPGSVPGTTPDTAPAAGIQHPTGADDVILKLSYEGGLVPVGFFFVNTPALLVSGDGRVFTPGLVPAIYPGPLLPTLFVRSIDEDGIQAMLGMVKAAGLLAPPPEYPDQQNIADASSTLLTIRAGGGTFVHSAYALGVGDSETGVRKQLLELVTAISDVDKAAGAAHLGTDRGFVPTVYRLQAHPVDPSQLTGQQPAPTVVEWPAAAGASLASAGTCARVDASVVGSLFLDATQNTFFKEGDIVYEVAVAGVLPGDPAC
jgi:hypothetical protein